MHRPGLINRVYASHVGGHIRQYKVDFVGADALQNLLENALFAEITLHELHTGMASMARISVATMRLEPPMMRAAY